MTGQTPMRKFEHQIRDRVLIAAILDQIPVVHVGCNDGDWPYVVPLSFGYEAAEEVLRVYLHCAREGRKVDLLRRFPQVCVTFVGDDRPVFVPPAMYSTWFQSVIITGTASEVTDPLKKAEALRALCQKLTPEHMDGFEAAVGKSLAVTAVWKVHMEEISGKAKLEG